MKVLILVDGGDLISPENVSYNIKTLQNALSLKGINSDLFGIFGIRTLDNIEIIPDIIFLQCHALNDKRLSEIQRLRDKGCLVIPSPEANMNFRDKLKVYEVLSNNNIPHPHTVILNNLDDCENLDLGWPCVIKPSNQSEGENVFLCDTIDELKSHFEILSQEYEGSASKILAQEYVKTGDDMVISCHVIGDKVSSLLNVSDPSKISQIKSTLRIGHQRIPIKTPPEVLDLIKKVKIALDVDICRIEFFLTQDGYKVCEVNVPGGRSGHDASSGFDISIVLADHILRRYNQS